jgi:hypothetical protein
MLSVTGLFDPAAQVIEFVPWPLAIVPLVIVQA